MKRTGIVLAIAFLTFLTGCAWLQTDSEGMTDKAYGGSGVERGTTGVSSGADGGAGITGSDAAPR
ncbi:MAG TPA: hypothetical protein VEC99_06055 [Clostridia bacterium]|nr:hypothetical protein [Clostridia bacterium]